MDQLFWERVITIVLVFFAIRFPKVVAMNGAIPALFSFGDSILDTGNNNDIKTIMKANFPPYGKDVAGGIPTGRFTNGKTPSDLIAGALGIKDILPAYLSADLSNDDLVTGVCFASAGSGIDDLTGGEAGVIIQPEQLRMLKEYIVKLTEIVGPKGAGDIISNSVYLISAGNNDVATTYSSIASTTTPFLEYVARLIPIASKFFESIYEVGARRVWVMSTLPLGCLPGVISKAGEQLRWCAPEFNLRAQLFNAQVSLAINSIKAKLPNYDIRFIDVYTPLLNLIRNHKSAGFEDVAEGCCSGDSGVCSVLTVCPDTSTYVFWDFAHPTERAYEILVSSILKSQFANNGSSSFALSSVS